MQLNQTKIEKLGKALIKSTSIEQDNHILESFKLKYSCSIYTHTTSHELQKYYLRNLYTRMYLAKLKIIYS